MNSVTYIIHSDDSDYCILIDCGEYDTLSPILSKLQKSVKAVLLTHTHFDHIAGLEALLNVYPDAEIYTTHDGHTFLGDARKNFSFYNQAPIEIKNYRKFEISGDLELDFKPIGKVKIIATPGHDKDCISYIVDKFLFTGDAYIPGLKVFTSTARANKALAQESRERLMALETNGYVVCCGHHSYD